MVSHCANPACNKELLYLREGKVFLFSPRKNPDASKLPHRLEHFWLCGACAKVWTLSMDGPGSPHLVELRRPREKRRYPAVAMAPAS
jgi:hypothetical protein